MAATAKILALALTVALGLEVTASAAVADATASRDATALSPSQQVTKTMTEIGKIKVEFIAGFGPIVRDPAVSRKLYGQTLGITFKEGADEYRHTESLPGAKSFALWPLSQAAQSCFGKDTWPADIPAPQAWLEFDVDDVESATAELEAQGVAMLIKNKKEPWGQTVSRFLSPEGVLVGITYTPFLRDGK